MPRYFLHVRKGDALIEDPDGIEMADLNAAKEEALQAAREILAEKLANGLMVDGEAFEICDESGSLLASVPFKDAFSTC